MQTQQPATLLQGKPYNKQTNVQETWKQFGWQPVNPGTTGHMDTAVIAEIGRSTHQSFGGGIRCAAFNWGLT